MPWPFAKTGMAYARADTPKTIIARAQHMRAYAKSCFMKTSERNYGRAAKRKDANRRSEADVETGQFRLKSTARTRRSANVSEQKAASRRKAARYTVVPFRR